MVRIALPRASNNRKYFHVATYMCLFTKTGKYAVLYALKNRLKRNTPGG
jgi:hypothetical protein